jgi:hypothetical protein
MPGTSPLKGGYSDIGKKCRLGFISLIGLRINGSGTAWGDSKVRLIEDLEDDISQLAARPLEAEKPRDRDWKFISAENAILIVRNFDRRLDLDWRQRIGPLQG